MRIGIIGAGNIGLAIARLAAEAGLDVVIANSRGPASLLDAVTELGSHAEAGTIEQAAAAGPVVVLTVPLQAVGDLAPELLQGRTVLSTVNYYPHRDVRITELDSGQLTTSQYVQQHLAGARVVQAFNNILAHHIPQLDRPAGARDRTTLPVAGDDAAARSEVRKLLEQLGFDTLDARTAADTWRFEPEAAGYTPIYLAQPLGPDDDIMTAPDAPAGREAVKTALASAVRIDVAARQF